MRADVEQKVAGARIRSTDEELAAWKEEAAREGLRFSGWARRCLNERVQLSTAIRAEEEGARLERERVKELAFPQQVRPDWRQ